MAKPSNNSTVLTLSQFCAWTALMHGDPLVRQARVQE